MFDRPPIEKYVRTTVTEHGYTLEPAVEWRDGDSFAHIVELLAAIAGAVAGASRHVGDDAMECAIDLGGTIAVRWPDRAYFVEVWQEGQSGFAQVFQPFGIPRNRDGV